MPTEQPSWSRAEIEYCRDWHDRSKNRALAEEALRLYDALEALKIEHETMMWMIFREKPNDATME